MDSDPQQKIWKLFKIAEQLANRSIYSNYSFGCVIATKKREIIGMGFNQGKTHPNAAQFFGQTIHAELHAILRSNKRKEKNLDMYVFRKNKKSGLIGRARPCKHCSKLIEEFGIIKRVFYTISESSFECWKV